jgi:hypothetical protein
MAESIPDHLPFQHTFQLVREILVQDSVLHISSLYRCQFISSAGIQHCNLSSCIDNSDEKLLKS